MILYFATNQMEIIGRAATHLKKGFVIIEDNKTEEIETGVSSLECRIGFNKSNRKRLETMTKAGNYILQKSNVQNEFYVILDREIDTKNQEIYIYAENAGIDLINEIAGEFEATEAKTAEWYINKWIIDSGFVIGINEIPKSSTRKLKWEGESTVTARLASIATQFGGYEVSYSFDIKGMVITKLYVNIHKQRGNDIGASLRLNKDIDRIITKETVANLATGFSCTGGTPEDAENPITLKGYKYDDGDFYVGESTGYLYSRKASEKWGRFSWAKNINQAYGGVGFIIRPYSYDTLNQATLCNHAITELKKVCDTEINYEVDIAKLPDNVKIGDRVNIIDETGELFLSSRILKLETSETGKTQIATIGEHLIKEGGIAEKVADMAAKFADTANTAAKAKVIADNAKSEADTAKTTADNALIEANTAQEKANEATAAANTATQSVAAATDAANKAQAAVEDVEKSVENLNTTVVNAQAAAEQAQQAAATAETKATEAQTAAVNAQKDAETAQQAAETAQNTANSANTAASNALTDADTAKTKAEEAATTAAAAKTDAEQAKKDVYALGESLTTVENTMKADYARKTELTETEASLQTQITQNAAGIASNASSIITIDETANNAAEQAAQAQTAAQAAQSKADTAAADAAKAQTAADEAQAAAEAAQSEADTAKAAAATAQGVADKANTDLATAKADLATVTSRVDATEEEIAAAEKAVEAAQAAANKANTDAATAVQNAANAQSVANTASQNATTAQNKADTAAQTANAAKAAAEAAQGDATTAKQTADEAKTAAQSAQATANTAKTNAENAQAKADEAAAEAAAAQTAADNADAKAAAAQSDLNTAKANLAAVTSRVGATEAEIAAAEQAVQAAQAAANAADEAAAAAQSTANTAKTNAANAQTVANNAKTAADNAQKAATDAQAAADAAQSEVDSLAVRVTSAETNISQNAEAIELRATKTEVATTLGGYYTKTQTDAKIKVEADKISSQATSISNHETRISTVEQTANGLSVKLDTLEIGGRNLIAGTSLTQEYSGNKGSASYKDVWTGKTINIPTGTEYVVSFEAKAAVAQTIACFFYSPNTTTSSKSSTGQSSTSADGQCYVTLTTEWKRYWVKWTQTAATAVKNVIVGRTTTANNIYIRAVKFEEGHTPTDWTPAPEDVDGDISAAQTAATSAQTTANTANSTANTAKTNAATAQSTADTAKTNAATAQSTANTARTEAAAAAKTATNFLSYDSANGLLIGNKSSGSWSGSRAQILPTAFNILDSSGTTLASYQANKVQLGVNSASSIIEMCGGKGQVAYGDVGILDGDYLSLYSQRVALQATGSAAIIAKAGTYSWSMANVEYGAIHLQAYRSTESDAGAAIYTGSNLEIYNNKIYGLADEIELISRYGTVLDAVTGGVTVKPILYTTSRIYANGGLRLTNGGQITGLTSSSTEITMLQMNANNYTMLGYGSYSNNIGATYVDGNVVNIRSKGALNITTATGIYMPNLTRIYMKDANGADREVLRLDENTSTPLLILGQSQYDKGDGITQLNSGAGVRLISTKDRIYFENSTNSSYSAHFRPNSNGTCTLGTSAKKWYAVYANNATIQTSDRREKENIVPIGIEQLITVDDEVIKVDLHSELFDRLQPVQYNFINGNKKTCYGLIAQDVIEVMHEIGIGETELDLVQHDFWTDEETGDTTETYGLAYNNLFALLIHEVQKLKAEIKTLKTN